MESLLPELRELISPRLKGKLYERQKNWMLVRFKKKKLMQTVYTPYRTWLSYCLSANYENKEPFFFTVSNCQENDVVVWPAQNKKSQGSNCRCVFLCADQWHGLQPGAGAVQGPVWVTVEEVWGGSPLPGGLHTNRHGPDHYLQRACHQQDQRFGLTRAWYRL